MVSFRPLGNILLTDLHKKTTYNKDQMAPIICRLFILTATMLFSIVAKKTAVPRYLFNNTINIGITSKLNNVVSVTITAAKLESAPYNFETTGAFVITGIAD